MSPRRPQTQAGNSDREDVTFVDWFLSLGPIGDAVAALVVCAVVAALIIAFRRYPFITGISSAAILAASGVVLFRILRKGRTDDSSWKIVGSVLL